MQNTRINLGIMMSTNAHKLQVRKASLRNDADSIPYIFHPFDVANEILSYSGLSGDDLETAVLIALLHDSVEDTDMTEDEIECAFGKEVSAGVMFLTKDSTLPKAVQFAENISRLRSAPPHVQAVKLADRISNLKNFPASWSRDKIASYVCEAEELVKELGAASATLSARLFNRAVETRFVLSLRT